MGLNLTLIMSKNGNVNHINAGASMFARPAPLRPLHMPENLRTPPPNLLLAYITHVDSWMYGRRWFWSLVGGTFKCAPDVDFRALVGAGAMAKRREEFLHWLGNRLEEEVSRGILMTDGRSLCACIEAAEANNASTTWGSGRMDGRRIHWRRALPVNEKGENRSFLAETAG